MERETPWWEFSCVDTLGRHKVILVQAANKSLATKLGTKKSLQKAIIPIRYTCRQMEEK